MSILVSKINYFGDSICFLPVLKALTEKHAKSTVHVLCTSVGKEVFSGLSENLHFHITDPVPRNAGPRRLFSLAMRLRREGLEQSFHSFDEPSHSYALAWAAGARERVGYGAGISRGERFLTRRLHFDTNRNVVDLNFDLARLGGEVAGHLSHPVRVPISYARDDYDFAKAICDGLGVEPKRFVMLHSGAKYGYRSWSREKFSVLGKRIEERFGLKAVHVAESRYEAESERRVVGGLTVKQLAALVEMAGAFVGNNSGPMHLSAAMGTPFIAIQGPSAPNWTPPWSDVKKRIVVADHLSCIPCERLNFVPGDCNNAAQPYGCLKGISVDEVERQSESLLAGI